MRVSTWVYDVDESSFERRVIERSRTVPVLVDFWASWCGPCLRLSPVLEQLIDEQAGKIELAKVDTDRNPRLSASFGIRGIPAVKLFRDGAVVAEFVGAQDTSFLRQFLADWIPSPNKEALAQARAKARSGAGDEAEALLRPWLDDREVGLEARAELAALLLGRGALDEAEATLEPLGDSDRANHLRQRIAMARDLAAAGGESGARARLERDPADLDARWALAAALEQRGEIGAALEALLEIVSRNRRYRDDGARKAMLALFDRLGPSSDLAREYRRRLQILT